MPRVLLDGTPKVQLSLDLQTMADALPTAEIAVRAGVDWLEVGTPLILGEGLHAVAALHQKYPDHPIIADLKTMDAGYLEAEMMFRNGASFVVVMGQAHEHTIREAVRAAKDYGGYVMGDIMLCPDKVAMAVQMEAMGVDVVIVHTGLDERHCGEGQVPARRPEEGAGGGEDPAPGGRWAVDRTGGAVPGARGVARRDWRAAGGRRLRAEAGRRRGNALRDVKSFVRGVKGSQQT